MQKEANGMSDITIVISTSYIPSAPSMRIIDETIESIRGHLPDSPMIITADGLTNDEWADEKGVDYLEYVEALSSRYEDDQVILFDEPAHQSGMLGPTLAYVATPFIYYLEHDWLTLGPIEWEPILEAMKGGSGYNYVKFHANDRIHPLHEHLMEERTIHDNVPYIHTRQWSQNPHLARTDFYASIYERYIIGKKDFIENCMHGVVGNSSWESFRCAIYNPIFGGMRRLQHLDGKGSK